MNRLTDDQLEEIVQRLEGQCMISPQQAVEEILVEWNDEIEAQIGERIFLCEGCGWYASTDELNNEGEQDLCDECEDSPHEL